MKIEAVELSTISKSNYQPTISPDIFINAEEDSVVVVETKTETAYMVTADYADLDAGRWPRRRASEKTKA